MIDYIKKNKHTGDIEDKDMERHSHNQQYSDLKEILDRAIEKLPEDQRSVLMLRDYEGYSYREIAEITYLSEAKVKVYVTLLVFVKV